MYRKILNLIVPFLFLYSLTGCSTFNNTQSLNNSQIGEGVDSYKTSFQGKKVELPVRVAILPFENLTNNDKAGCLVRNSFYSQFASKRYRDIELFEIDEILDDNGLYEDNKYNSSEVSTLGRLLNADGIVYGKITGYNKLYLGLYSQVYVELEVKLVEASTGKVLWEVKHRTAHHEGEVPLELIGVISAIFRTTKNISNTELVSATDDLCRTIVSALPEPELKKVYARRSQVPSSL